MSSNLAEDQILCDRRSSKRRRTKAIKNHVEYMSREEALYLRQALKISKQETARTVVEIDDAPVFRPSEAEFADPISYIRSIRSAAEPHGICKIVPPAEWNPPCQISLDHPGTFATNKQRVNALQTGEGFDEGGTFTVRQYKAMADEFYMDWWRNHYAAERAVKQSPMSGEVAGAGKGDGGAGEDKDENGGDWYSDYTSKSTSMTCLQTLIDLKDLRKDYWDLVETNHTEAEVRYGNDIDSSVFGSGFPKQHRTESLLVSPPVTSTASISSCPVSIADRESPAAVVTPVVPAVGVGVTAPSAASSAAGQAVDIVPVPVTGQAPTVENMTVSPVVDTALTLALDNVSHTTSSAAALDVARNISCPQVPVDPSRSEMHQPSAGGDSSCSIGGGRVGGGRVGGGKGGGGRGGDDSAGSDSASGASSKSDDSTGGDYSSAACGTPQQQAAQYYAQTWWNLNNIPKAPGSLLRFLDLPINGINVPWMYIGMLFASFCWHNEDNYLYSISYLHTGAAKQWYGVPGDSAELFEKVSKDFLLGLFRESPDLLHHMTTQISPSLLAANGVPVYKMTQELGTFIVTFPKSFHAGFSYGFNIGEAVNFAPSDWLPAGGEAEERYRSFARPSIFSHQRLLFTLFHNKDKIHGLAPELLCAEMLHTIEQEQAERKAAKKRGVRTVYCVPSQNNFASITRETDRFDEMRTCCMCKQACIFTAVGCPCDARRVSCLLHFKTMCSCRTPAPRAVATTTTTTTASSTSIERGTLNGTCSGRGSGGTSKEAKRRHPAQLDVQKKYMIQWTSDEDFEVTKRMLRGVLQQHK